MATKKKSAKKKTKVVKVVAKKAKKGKVVAKPVQAKSCVKPASKVLGKIRKPLTKSELYKAISEGSCIGRKSIAHIFDMLGDIVALHLKKDGPEKFVLPGLLKIVVKKVPARPARDGINPFTGEMTVFKAKPASKKVKVIALKNLKGFV